MAWEPEAPPHPPVNCKRPKFHVSCFWGALPPKRSFADFQLTITGSRRRTVQRRPLNNIFNFLELEKKVKLPERAIINFLKSLPFEMEISSTVIEIG